MVLLGPLAGPSILTLAFPEKYGLNLAPAKEQNEPRGNHWGKYQ